MSNYYPPQVSTNNFITDMGVKPPSPQVVSTDNFITDMGVKPKSKSGGFGESDLVVLLIWTATVGISTVIFFISVITIALIVRWIYVNVLKNFINTVLGIPFILEELSRIFS